MTTQDKDRLIPVTEAALRLGCSRAHVYDLIAAGQLRRHNISLKGSKTRVSEVDLDRYIRDSEVPVRPAS